MMSSSVKGTHTVRVIAWRNGHQPEANPCTAGPGTRTGHPGKDTKPTHRYRKSRECRKAPKPTCNDKRRLQPMQQKPVGLQFERAAWALSQPVHHRGLACGETVNIELAADGK